MEIRINGIVQGVGFRPFIHKLVSDYKIYGWVKNTSKGVILEVEGNIEILNSFAEDIKLKSPKLAVIETIDTKILDELQNYESFNIIKSTNEENDRFTLISPDVSICEDCERELLTPGDRRYEFPFINCTNCGPRFTIIKDIPYDRDKTTMKAFKMCSACEEEYGDINDRRYHAQPDCCFECGPELYFTDCKGIKLPGSPIKQAIKYIVEDKIIAVKGIGGFHLACNANNLEVIKELRYRKKRDEKPFAIMCKDINTVEKWCEVSDREKELLTSFRRPIVLLKKKNKNLDMISPDNDYLGVMLPYTPVHLLLFNGEIDTIIMTSGNISDTPIIHKNDEALKELEGVADGFLMNNRDIHVRCDDSLIRIFEGKEYPLRRSRGYVPFPIKIRDKVEKILACGAEQKASFALSREDYVFLSQHIGDMKNIETYDNYVNQIGHFENMFDIKPTKIVCDLHPDYMSTEYAEDRSKRLKVPLYFVQHHHAHMASCMADNNISSEVIGIVWDGTGYGGNGEIWGGEILIGGFQGFNRGGSIRPIALPGGDRCTKETYRIAYSLLYDSYGKIPEKFSSKQNVEIIEKLLRENINCPKSSSIGRLFDGVSALLGIKEISSYEGQGAIALEGIAEDSEDKYKCEIYEENGIRIFDWIPMVKDIVYDIEEGTSKGLIAAKFMNTLSDMASEMTNKISKETNIIEVVLSGGVFQNMYLLRKIKSELEGYGFKVYTHSRVSTNDEGIALGQLLIAQNGGSVKCV